MILMKKVSLSTSLFSAALLMSATNFACANTIYNPNFDALTLEDGNSSATIHNWEITSGIAGIHNPGNEMFPGESGTGLHSNTLYMIDNSTTSQTLTFKAQASSTYDLHFDVGQRVDMPAQNYSVKVMAGDKTLLWAANPDVPSTPGSFKHVNVQFTTEDSSDEFMTVEIKTEGNGHLHFDNFELTSKLTNVEPAVYYRTVAHLSHTEGQGWKEHFSLPQPNGSSYVNFRGQCQNSIRIAEGSSTSLSGKRSSYHRCVVLSTQ